MDEVLYETDGAIATITLNRPEQRNALNVAAREGIRAAFERFEADPDLRVAILTAAGDKAFCAGMDLKEAAQTGLKVPPKGKGGFPVIGDNLDVTKPTIAAVNGIAVAGGWLMAQMCDLCLAADTAVFGITEAKVGRGMPWAVPLTQMLPQRITLELLMTGDVMSARRLHDLGYLNRVVPPDQLMAAAREMATRIAQNAPLSVDAAREMIFMTREHPHADAMTRADDIFERVYLSEDAQEGPRAFAEKRKPVWSGR